MPDSVLDGWAWFDDVPAQAADAEVRSCFVRAFNTGAGREVLSYLRTATVERRTPPGASDAFLRHLEGQRFLFQQIERLANAQLEEPDHHE